MAAKHDGRHAANNLWVTQQNLARAKGGRPHYQAKLRGPKAVGAHRDANATGPKKPAETAVADAAPEQTSEA